MPHCAGKCFANSSSLYPQKKNRAYVPAGNNKRTWKANQDVSGNIFTQTVPRNSRPQNNLTVNPSYNRAPRHIEDHKYRGPLNPIKQWRKQLAPEGGTQSSRASVSQSMDYPGGSTHLEKKHIVTDCSSCDPLLTSYLKENPGLNNCSSCTVIRNQLSNFQPVSINNPQRVTRPRSSQTKVNKNYYTTGAAYLRSRVKLHEQNQLLSAIPGNTYAPSGSGAGPGHILSNYVPPSNSLTTGSQAFNSTYCISDASACCLDGSSKCSVNITYKPSNPAFSTQGAVSSGTRILDIKHRAVIKNYEDFYRALPGSTPVNYRGDTEAAYFIKSKYQPIDAISLILGNKTRVGSRMPAGGTGIRTVCFPCLEKETTTHPVESEGSTLPVESEGSTLPIGSGGNSLPIGSGGNSLPIGNGGNIVLLVDSQNIFGDDFVGYVSSLGVGIYGLLQMGDINLSTISISNGGAQDQKILNIIVFNGSTSPTIQVGCELLTAFPSTQSYNLTISTNSKQQKILSIPGSENILFYSTPMGELLTHETNMKDILNDIIDNKTPFRINIELYS